MPLIQGGSVEASDIVRVAREVGTPAYLYDESMIRGRCERLLAMPNAFGLEVRYAMKANSNRAILGLVTSLGLGLDASSLNEVRRARLAGVACDRIMLTTQEVPEVGDRADLEDMMREGLRYNVCSLRQLELVLPFAKSQNLGITLRVNPGAGAGESVTRNTGDKYSSFGVPLSALPGATRAAQSAGVRIDQVHVHIGSGGDPRAWQDNIDRMLAIVEESFRDATRLCLGGGFKEARMPDEERADIQALGAYARERFLAFAARTGRKLQMGVEPGTYVVANAGYLVTRVLDKKSSGPGGFEFLLLDGGMEANTRPLLYGSRHPFYVVSRDGSLLSSEWTVRASDPRVGPRVVAGRCCESGDSQTLDATGHVIPRLMADPEVGDYVVIGGAGAYCSAMSLTNYNSHAQAPEVVRRLDGRLAVVRTRQTLEQMVANERGL